MRLPDCMMPDGTDPCCGAKEMIDQIERLTAELEKANITANVLQGQLTIARGELVAAKETADQALELADDLYSYCIDQWRWKYGEYWDSELAAIRAALSQPQKD